MSVKNFGVRGLALAVAAQSVVVGQANATVDTKLYADSYIVTDAGRTYSILDVYVKGNHLGDKISAAILGLNTHDVIFKTSLGTATSDIFVHGGTAGNGWLPTDSAAKSWDSFVAAGNRAQGANAKVTNRAGTLVDYSVAGNWTAASGFTQMGVPGSSWIDTGPTSGWYSSLGGGAYSSAAASENPFARVSLYNSTWNSTYTDLYRGADVLYTKGQMQTGRTTAAGSAVLSGAPGDSLDFYWMVGRFAIDITDRAGQTITMQTQFNIVGKNGTGNETGTTITGATTPAYKVSNYFTFIFPPPPAPTGFTATDGASTSGVTLSWNASSGATSYSIMRSAGGQTPVQVGSSASLNYADTSAVPGTLYTYFIYAIGGGGTSSTSTSDTGWRRLSPPASVTASDGTFGSRVDVAWAASTGATLYKVRRAALGGTAAVIGTPTTTAFADTTAVPGQTYEYSVLASCVLGDSDPSAIDTGSRMIDCNDNGVVDSIDLNPPISIATGNMGTLVGATTRSASRAIAAVPTSNVTVTVDALGDLDLASEYLLLRLSSAANPSGVARDLFKDGGLACPATPQRTSFVLTPQEFMGALGGSPGTLKIDVTPMIAVGRADSTCQASSSVSVTLDYVSRNAAIDCNSNGVIDSCEIASGAVADCNLNGVPDSCDLANGTETDLNGNSVLDRCEYLVGSPAWPTLSSAVSAAPNGAVVPVLPGVYDGPVDLGSKGLTLRSTGGKGVTTIRGTPSTSAVRVSGAGRIEGFFIQGGGGDQESGVRGGGALRITAGTVTVKDCDIRAGDVGYSGEGGLVFIRDAAPTFDTCRLEMGSAGLGGGVHARATGAGVFAPTFTNCIVRQNMATSGGGLFLRGAGMRPVLSSVNFELNVASSQGGAIMSVDGARPVLLGCRACGNTTPVTVGSYGQTGLNWMTDDCNGDGLCDADQIASGALSDDDADGIPDTCQDCDRDGESDRFAIAQGWVADCNGNLVPDRCDIANGALDCNGNGIPDTCDASDVRLDCNRDGQLDACQSLADCNANGRPDVCEIASGAVPDCDGNGVPDACDLVNGIADCNANGVPDRCDIAAGTSEDQEGNGVPDSCQYARGDLDLSGVVDTADVSLLLLFFDSTGPIGDLDGDGIVTTADLALLLLNFE